jgi:hypothetical protein
VVVGLLRRRRAGASTMVVKGQDDVIDRKT